MCNLDFSVFEVDPLKLQMTNRRFDRKMSKLKILWKQIHLWMPLR